MLRQRPVKTMCVRLYIYIYYKRTAQTTVRCFWLNTQIYFHLQFSISDFLLGNPILVLTFIVISQKRVLDLRGLFQTLLIAFQIFVFVNPICSSISFNIIVLSQKFQMFSDVRVRFFRFQYHSAITETCFIFVDVFQTHKQSVICEIS